jgi:hypothetical protein
MRLRSPEGAKGRGRIDDQRQDTDHSDRRWMGREESSRYLQVQGRQGKDTAAVSSTIPPAAATKPTDALSESGARTASPDVLSIYQKGEFVMRRSK